MRPSFVRPQFLAPVAALVLAAAPSALLAQRAAAAAAPAAVQPGLTVTPYAGVAVFGDLTGGSLGIGLSTSAGTVYGAQVAIPLSPRASVLANGAYGSGNISFGLPVIGGVTLGTTELVLADVGLEVGFPEGAQLLSGFRPFVQGGGGLMRRKLSGFGYSTEANDAAFNLGGGADLALGRAVSLRLMAKDYMGRFDLKEATSVPLQTSMTHNWMITAGLKLDL